VAYRRHGIRPHDGFVVTGRGAAQIGLLRGTALYVGALIGPGLLLIPALGVQAAGPASILAWLGLLLLSVPLAATFAALAVRYPVAAGVSAYVRAGFGDSAAAVAGAWFLAAIFLGAPAVSLIGGYYVTDLTGGGSPVAVFVAICMFMTVITSNAMGLRVSSSVQFGLSTILVVVLAVALAFALPLRGGDNWAPFAPRGWRAIGTAANILIWMFVGWEAVAQLAGEFKRPSVDLPRAMALAFAIITILYLALAVATVGVTGSSRSQVPLADLVSVGFGRVGRDLTAVLAVTLTMGTMNVYMGGGAKLALALADAGAVPRWLARADGRSVPLRPLMFFAAVGLILLATLAMGFLNATDLIRSTSSLFVGIYVLSIASAVRILKGRARVVAASAAVMVVLVACFSGWYVAVPAVVAMVALLQHALHRWRATTERRASTAPSMADSWRRP
jgi:amino acid efflux transporter